MRGVFDGLDEALGAGRLRVPRKPRGGFLAFGYLVPCQKGPAQRSEVFFRLRPFPGVFDGVGACVEKTGDAFELALQEQGVAVRDRSDALEQAEHVLG